MDTEPFNPVDPREWRRMQAWRLRQLGWKQCDIALALRARPVLAAACRVMCLAVLVAWARVPRGNMGSMAPEPFPWPGAFWGWGVSWRFCVPASGWRLLARPLLARPLRLNLENYRKFSAAVFERVFRHPDWVYPSRPNPRAMPVRFFLSRGSFMSPCACR